MLESSSKQKLESLRSHHEQGEKQEQDHNEDHIDDIFVNTEDLNHSKDDEVTEDLNNQFMQFK